jgi:hypothetical protein
MCCPPDGQEWCLCRDALEWAKVLLGVRNPRQPAVVLVDPLTGVTRGELAKRWR